MARLSVPGAKLWTTYNPESPAHWFMRHLLDRMDLYTRVRITDFRLEDNPVLSDEVKDRYRRDRLWGILHSDSLRGSGRRQVV